MKIALANSSGNEEFQQSRTHTFSGESSCEIKFGIPWTDLWIVEGRFDPDGNLNFVCSLRTFGTGGELDQLLLADR